MPRIYVQFSGLKQIGVNCKEIAEKVEAVQSDFQRIAGQLDWDIRYEKDIGSKADQIARKLESYSQALNHFQRFIDEAYAEYEKLDTPSEDFLFSKGEINPNIFQMFGPGGQTPGFLDIFWDNFGWKGLLSGAGYIGTIYDLINDIRNGKTWKDFAKSGIDIFQFLSGAGITYKNYKRIGNAVGTKKAMGWWVKNITGLKPLGRASTAKNPVTRFVNNLTNKTSPFNAQLKNVIKDFKGANGVGKAVASWGSVAADGVLNWFGNKEEQANSNGSMSDGRVIAETVTETVVDTVFSYGAGAVIGAGVTAALGTVAAPGIVVAAAGGAVIAGVNAGVEYLTGKTATEWVSDTILDAGEAIGNAVGNAVKGASEVVGSWFKKLSFG